MKKLIAVICSIALCAALFAACGKTAEADVDVRDIYEKIASSAAMPAESIELTKNDLLDYYGISPESVAECVAVQDACGYKDEIVIIKAVDENAADEINGLLEEHIAYQCESMRNYDAAQYEILCSSKTVENGCYTAMFISAEQDKMNDIFNSFFD